jgi:hypothetical protein
MSLVRRVLVPVGGGRRRAAGARDRTGGEGARRGAQLPGRAGCARGAAALCCVATHQHLSAKKVGELFEKAMGPKGQEAIVTFLDEIELRGEARGKREGKREALLELLAARFGRVPARLQARIHAADDATLGRWTVRVLTAKGPRPRCSATTLAAVGAGAPPRPRGPEPRASARPRRRSEHRGLLGLFSDAVASVRSSAGRERRAYALGISGGVKRCPLHALVGPNAVHRAWKATRFTASRCA